MSTRALAVLVIVVVLVGGAIGISYPKSKQASSTSTTLASSSSSSSTSTSSNSAATSSSSASLASSTASNTTTTTPPAEAPLFNFSITSSPNTILISSGQVLNYSSIVLIPAPNSLQGGGLLANNGIGAELVVLNATVPNGMYIHFFGSTLINRIYEEAGAGTVMITEMQLVAPASVAPGNYTVKVEASSGSLSVNYEFTLQVVKYLIIAQFYTFEPRNLTVPAGTTVYWINMSTDKNQMYDVIFSELNVHSPTLNPEPAFDSFSYTFTTPGTYPYYCAYLAAMTGTINVTS